MRPVIAATLIAPLILAVAGCTTTPSRLDQVTQTSQASQTSEAPPPTATDRDERLARVERRLDKVVAALDQALGPAEPDPASTYAVPVDEQDPIEGPRDAKVTIVEGYEFLCPYCYLANPLIEQIRAKYPKDVRVVSKYLVIHGQPAVTAGLYACAAAKQGKFPEMKAALWNNLWKTENGRPEAHPEAVEHLDAIATSLGLDHDRLTRDLGTCQEWIASSERELTAVGVHGTPAFFVNGRPLRERSFAALDKLVSEELARANDSHVAAADYYDREIVGKGLKQVKSRFAD
jgi:protein-disulfide isomerase